MPTPFISQLPGRKSDDKDAAWIGECLQKKQIKESFAANHLLQQMRQCHRLTKNRVRLEQQMDNQLQRCNIRFSNYISNQGKNVSRRKIIRAIIGNDETAGKIRSRKTLHGNKYPRQMLTECSWSVTKTEKFSVQEFYLMLTECSWSVTRSNKTFPGRKFNHLSKRMKAQKALVAIARKMLVIIYNVLKTGIVGNESACETGKLEEESILFAYF